MSERSPVNRWLGRTVWLLIGIGFAYLLFVDPWNLHSVDRWLGGASMPVDTVADEAHSGHDHPEGTLWTCSMHPEVLADELGSCPICGMDLTPILPETENAVGSATVPESDGNSGAGASGGLADGRASVRIDPSVIQAMNVRIEQVERRDLSRTIRAVGSLDYDPEGVVTVTTKFSGFVERVYANYPGQSVRRGAALFEIYSPELIQTQEELLSTLAFARRLESTSAHEAGETAALHRAEALVEAARTRLKRWDITTEQIERLERSGEPFRTLTVVSPAGGVITERIEGLEGMAVSPGTRILQIADLSSLLLTVEVFEDQLASIGRGSRAQISLASMPGVEIEGTVRFIEPALDAETRTARLLVEVANRDGRLRPGMYADATFLTTSAGAEKQLTIPSQAVLRTGTRQLVVVALGDGRFEPREVTTGVEADGQIEILSGLADGDHVATSAQFLIDSESNLRAAIQQMIAGRSVRKAEERR